MLFISLGTVSITARRVALLGADLDFGKAFVHALVDSGLVGNLKGIGNLTLEAWHHVSVAFHTQGIDSRASSSVLDLRFCLAMLTDVWS